jgi:hypothetical protein
LAITAVWEVGREVLLVATIPGTSLAVTAMTALGMMASDKEDNYDAVAVVLKGGVMLYVEIYHRAQVRSFGRQDLFLPHLSTLTRILDHQLKSSAH